MIETVQSLEKQYIGLEEEAELPENAEQVVVDF